MKGYVKVPTSSGRDVTTCQHVLTYTEPGVDVDYCKSKAPQMNSNAFNYNYESTTASGVCHFKQCDNGDLMIVEHPSRQYSVYTDIFNCT